MSDTSQEKAAGFENVFVIFQDGVFLVIVHGVVIYHLGEGHLARKTWERMSYQAKAMRAKYLEA